MTSRRPTRSNRVRLAALGLIATVVLAACQFGSPPLDNPTGTKPGLAATEVGRRADARKVIARVRTAGRGPKTGYTRAQFGPTWTDSSTAPLSRNGCDTRNDILKRDLTKRSYRAGTHDCVVIAGVLEDPYTAKTINFAKASASAVQIDHVHALSYAWQMGAANWDQAKRTRFANDPLNLMAVDGPTNGSKGDSSIASWLPPNKAVRCSYALRQAQVSLAYDLPVTVADKAMMTTQCS